MREPPDHETLPALHARLLSGERSASEVVTRLLLAKLIAEVTRSYTRVDEQLIADGVIDALLDYCERPQQFDATHGISLDRFLVTTARQNVDNLLRSEHRRKARERKAGSKKCEADVAFDPVAGNIRREEQDLIERQRMAMNEALTSETDREVLRLWWDGVKGTGEFAHVLGLEHLTSDEQRKCVKRHKDRILRFLRRKGLLS